MDCAQLRAPGRATPSSARENILVLDIIRFKSTFSRPFPCPPGCPALYSTVYCTLYTGHDMGTMDSVDTFLCHWRGWVTGHP